MTPSPATGLIAPDDARRALELRSESGRFLTRAWLRLSAILDEWEQRRQREPSLRGFAAGLDLR
jgi:hypothetical protein